MPSAFDTLPVMRVIVPLLALGLAVLPAPATAAPSVPTGRWVVNFDDAQCIASRAYGEDQLILKASPLGDIVQFGLVQQGHAGQQPQQVLAIVQPAKGAPYRGNAIYWSSTGKKPVRLRMINMPVAEFQRLSASPTLSFQIGELRRNLAISALPEMAKVMKSCVDDLQKVWSSEGGVAARATADLGSYFTSDDYPADAVRDALSGTTGFALLVDEQGRIADCMVVQTSGHAGLDMQSCAILKGRARFRPARDTAGKPTRDRASGRIAWRIP